VHDGAILAEPIREWLCAHVEPVGPVEVVRSRTWTTTSRVPTAHGPVWLKACAPSDRFEPGLVARLADGWPELLPAVIAHDASRRLLLQADAGMPFEELGNPPELWLRLLPRYAELQREASIPPDVPDRSLERWPQLYEELARSELPLLPAEAARLGPGLADAFELAQRIGRFVHAFSWIDLRRRLPDELRATYDVPFAAVLRRALAVA